MKYKIYVIDDEQSIRDAVTVGFGDQYEINTFENAEEGLDSLEADPPDLVLLDIGLPGMDGIEALKRIKGFDPDIIAVMITAYEDVDTVIRAMKLGAEDYVIKPLDMDRLEVTVGNALDSVRLKKEVQQLQEQYLKENTPLFIRESDAIQDVMEFVNKIAKSPDTPVLIQGETGTGKELLAQAIHYRSPNFKGNFVTVNCAAVPKDLIESELFGYDKGAFTGASKSGKNGMVEEAADGTLFLDEVGDLSHEAQAKLLRFLETGEFYRVGSTKKRCVHTRVVSATNKDLQGMIQHDEFRKDLLFRLGVVQVRVPSLNERREEIPALAKHFLNEFSTKFGKDVTGISSEAEQALKRHTFTGHVRELKNVIERAVLVGSGPELTLDDLGLGADRIHTAPHAAGSDEMPKLPELTRKGIDYDLFVQTIENHYFSRAMDLANGNMSKAAELLGLNYFTFRHRKEKLEESADNRKDQESAD